MTHFVKFYSQILLQICFIQQQLNSSLKIPAIKSQHITLPNQGVSKTLLLVKSQNEAQFNNLFTLIVSGYTTI